MTDICLVGVPQSDAADLMQLATRLGVDIEPVEHRYLDGAAFTELIIPLVISGAAWETLRVWIKSRADVQKATRVTFKGMEITATKPEEAVKIIRLLMNRADVDED